MTWRVMIEKKHSARLSQEHPATRAASPIAAGSGFGSLAFSASALACDVSI